MHPLQQTNAAIAHPSETIATPLQSLRRTNATIAAY
jgi:hypothetical protein